MDKRKEMLERARAKSVGEEKKVRYVNMRRDDYIKNLKITFVSGAIIAILAAGGLVFAGHTVINNANQYKIVNQELSEYSTIVNENTHRTDDNQNYFYDTYDIASAISKDQSDIDKAIYGVYSNIGYNKANKLSQMDNVISSVEFTAKADEVADHFSNFSDYVISKGYIDKDGKADFKAYENAMTQMLVDENAIEELQSQVDNIKSR